MAIFGNHETITCGVIPFLLQRPKHVSHLRPGTGVNLNRGGLGVYAQTGHPLRARMETTSLRLINGTLTAYVRLTGNHVIPWAMTWESSNHRLRAE